MEKLRLRCPTCAKLYEVNESDVKSDSPQFDCVLCATRFTFAYPPAQIHNIETHVVFTGTPAPQLDPALGLEQELAQKSFAAFQQEIEEKVMGTRACPKCGAVNDKKFTECYSCHVIFERLDQLPLDVTLHAQPSLVRKWKNLVMNFDKLSLHEDFLKSCHELEALRFAIMKYEDLKSAQGGSDELCERMIFKAHALMQTQWQSKSALSVPGRSEVQDGAHHYAWIKYLLLAPLTVSLMMIFVGFWKIGMRNMVGSGVAIFVLTLGLIFFWKGRLSFHDFID